jgi:hypothetical protein
MTDTAKDLAEKNAVLHTRSAGLFQRKSLDEPRKELRSIKLIVN